MAPTYWDTHCHLNDPSFAERLPDVLARARGAGVIKVVVPAYDVPSLLRARELGEEHRERLLPALGVHPWYIPEEPPLEEIEDVLRAHPGWPVGEVGLDFSPERAAPQRQLQVFTQQLRMALRLGRPILIHCRKAHNELIPVLRRARPPSFVIHSFSGSWEIAQEYLKLGGHLSFSGSVTRRNGKRVRAVAGRTPLDRLLLETDAPSIATETKVASQVEPADVVEVARAVAELRGLSLAAVAEATTRNARELFGGPWT